MGKLIHPSGDLTMDIEGIGVEGEELCITGQMGVWKAKILLPPNEVIALARLFISPQILRYMAMATWKALGRRQGG
jgi:hypothetical protein